VVLARELTKKFEEFLRGKPAELLEIAQKRSLKGEFVVLVGRHRGRGNHGHSLRAGTAARTAVGSTGGFTGQHRHCRFAVKFSGLVRESAGCCCCFCSTCS
jgi:hypothetical protein